MMHQRFVARLRMRQRLVVLGLAAFVGAFVIQRETAVPQAQGPVTFSQHVAPILFANCTTCHRPGEAAPFQLMTYRDARPLAKAIAAATASRVMPPWKAAPGDVEFANARRLTDSRSTRSSAGSPMARSRVTRRCLPALPTFTEGWQLGPPDLAVTMSEAFEVPASGPDVYRSFVVPLNLDRDVWVRAIDFRPSARAVVHHSLFFLDATGAARERDAEDPGPGFRGSMGGGVQARRRAVRRWRSRRSARGGGGADDPPADPIARVAGGLGGWALGGRALELPDGSRVPAAERIRSGSLHALPSIGQGADGEVNGRPVLRIGSTDAGVHDDSAAAAVQRVRGNRHSAGQERYTLQDSFVIPIDVKAFSVGAHAHYLGKEMKLTATLPDGAVKTLLWIKDWDFSWQERYRFKDFVSLPAGHAARRDRQLRQLGGEQAQSEPSAGARHVGRGIDRRDGQHRSAGGRRHSRRAAATAARVQRASAHGRDDASRAQAAAANDEHVD